ncbi:hypothetical protein RhiJN_05089 [Ceratobasidium sp. AG-Ba]|nr:hypothetical protein RhiJN_05089 [Ceratobasidium sp. AG-Ba]
MARPKSSVGKKVIKRTPKEYPDHLPSRTLTQEHCDWLEPFQDEYASHVGKKGAPDSAFHWVRSTITNQFLDYWFPTLSKQIREEFRPWIGTSINSRFNNVSNSPNVTDPLESGKAPSSAMYLWTRENQAMVDESWAAECMQNPKLINNPGKRRSHVSTLWGGLTAAQKQPYMQRYAELKAEFANRKVPTEQQQKFFNDLVKKQSSVARGAERQSAVFVLTTLATAIDGVLTIKQVGSPLANQFLKTDEAHTMMDMIGGFLNESIGSLERQCEGDPPVAVTPVRNENMRPLIPDVSEHHPTLQLMRSMIRTTISAIWQLHGGIGPVPYKEIVDAMEEGDYSWIPQECLPKDAALKESGYFTVKESLVWLRHLALWKFGASPTTFRFTKTYSLNRSPLSGSEVSHRVPTTRNNKPAWISTFDAPINYPQNVHPVSYPRASWEYLYFIKKDIIGLEHWAGLPSRSASDETPADSISPDESATLDEMFAGSREDICGTVNRLVNALRKHESLLPVWDAEGLWKNIDGRTTVPTALPFVQPIGLNVGLLFWRQEWLPGEYFQRLKLGRELSRIDYVESWLDSVLEEIARHARSGTLIGGKNGIVWAARLVIKITANAAALTQGTGVTFRVPLPANCDPKHLGSTTLGIALEWANDLAGAIEKSIEILEVSWPERSRPEDVELDKAEDTQDPLDPKDSVDPGDTFDPEPPSTSRRRPLSDAQGNPANNKGPNPLSDEENDSRGDQAMDHGEGQAKKGKGKEKEDGEKSVKRKRTEAKRARTLGEFTKLDVDFDIEVAANRTLGLAAPLVIKPHSDAAKKYLKKNERFESKWKAELQEAETKFVALKNELMQQYKDGIECPNSTPEQRRAKYSKTVDNWTDKDSIFDVLLELIPLEIPSFPPDALRSEINGYISKLTDSMTSWQEASDEWNTSYVVSTIQQGAIAASMHGQQYPGLVFAIAIHGNMVAEAQGWYKSTGVEHREQIFKYFSGGCSLLKHIQKFEEAGTMPELDIGTVQYLRTKICNTLQATSPSQSPLETGAFDVLLARRAEDYTPKTKRLDTLHRAVIDSSTLDYIYEQPQEAATHQAKIRRRRRRIQNRK